MAEERGAGICQAGIAGQADLLHRYLDQFPPAAYVALPEGSWGAESNNSVWLNEDTAWTWKHIYPAELAVQQMANSGLWRGQ